MMENQKPNSWGRIDEELTDKQIEEQYPPIPWTRCPRCGAKMVGKK